MSAVKVKVGRRELQVSNLEKVLYPSEGFTKGQVIDYYLRIAPVVLPHVKGRPLTLKRYPSGVDAEFFYEKRCPTHRPDWIVTKPIRSERSKGDVNYCVIDDVPALIWVANLASIELHALLCRTSDITRPTSMVFDLDPGAPAGILQCAAVALRLRDVLKEAGLESFAKTSGGKGLHMWVPLNTAVTFERTKGFARAMAEMLARHDAAGVTANMRKSLRTGRVFIDWSQNDDHKTTVCAYSLRARERPTVSTPVTWKELEQARKRGDEERLVFTAGEVLKRVERLGDLFEPVLTLKQRLPEVGG